MGHQTMLNLELEDHTGGDLGYLNSLCIDYLVLAKNHLQILETIFISDGQAAFFGDTLVTIYILYILGA